MNKKETPLVSVVIPTYNSSKTIRECLESIFAQSYQNLEIIIIDDNSTDGTIKIAEEYLNKKIPVYIYVNSTRRERSFARNFGAKVARGKYLYFVDSDLVPEKNLIKEAVTKCEQEGLDGVSVFWT